MAPRTVFCTILQKEAPGIDATELQGEVALDMVEAIGGKALRQRIYDKVSWEAWEQWKGHLTMLMNEHRLDLMDPQTDAFIREQMEAFFFGGGAEPPSGYVPPTDKE
ncbi:MAG: oxidative damage protection protein [bacterium]|nr:oxidative damage protection protein [bacterium]